MVKSAERIIVGFRYAETYHGKPCRKCGGTERYQKRCCVVCTRAKATKKYFQYPKASNAKIRKWWENNKIKIRAKKYGLTEEQLETFLMETKRCPGCLVLISHATSRIDHEHSTGKVRGILCSACNFTIGHAKDDVEILKRLIEYLKREKCHS